MDRRKDIQEFLKSRRARLTPEQAGLASFGERRRVTGLRREEVAMLAGVSMDYYARLERGHLAGASEVLEAVARALQFDDAERQHLLDLARNTEPGTPSPTDLGPRQPPCGRRSQRSLPA
jgi:transcriptional regulator with XRE-family HTH domain